MLVMPTGAKRVSSRMTFFYKRVFPLIWFGFVGFLFIVALKAMLTEHDYSFSYLIYPLGLGVIVYWIMRKFTSDLLDEVWDNVHELILVNKDHVEHVSLTDITNVSYSGFTNPKRVTLRLKRPVRWGANVVFSPTIAYGLAALARHPVVEDLIGRVEAARRTG